MKNAINEIKGAISELKSADAANAERIATGDAANANRIAEVENKLAELKADLPLLYVTREDFIRVTDNIDRKLDRIISFGSGGQKKEE